MMLTEADPIIGWEAISPTVHPIRGEHLLSERLWHARDKLIENALREDGWFDQAGLDHLADLATQLSLAEPCACVLPEQSCSACRMSAHASYILQEMGA